MKTIIAPVDFSDASTNALAFASELANRAAARLIVVNVMKKGQEEAEVKGKLKVLELELKGIFGTGLACESLVWKGTLVTSMNEVVNIHRPDLIVMGTKGASGLKRILIGSNTVKLIAKTKVPVLVIPEKARFKSFLRKGKNRIILATDLEELKNEEPLDILKEIALLMVQPKIRVLSVRPRRMGLDYLKRMERRALVSSFQPEIETERVTVFSLNVLRGIKNYLKKHYDTGLVAMIARDSGMLIQRHYTREMAAHTQFPLLVLHDAKR